MSSICDTDRALHTLTRCGKKGENWALRHRIHIQAWEARHRNVHTTESADPLLSYYDPYMVWYRTITRIRVGPLPLPVPASGYQTGAYIRDALSDHVARVSALSQDVMCHGDSSHYQHTIQQIHHESVHRLEHLDRSYLIPPPESISTNDTYYMDPQRHSTVRQAPTVCAEAFSSHGPNFFAYSEYDIQGGASVAREIYDDFYSSLYACQETAQHDDFEHIQPAGTRTDEYSTQGAYEDPTQGVEYKQSETQGTFGGVNHSRRSRTRARRVHRVGIQISNTNVPIPEDKEYVPHHDPSHVHTRISRFGRSIRPRGCGT